MKRILVTIAFFSFLLSLTYSQFNGTYTINKSAPASETNYKDFNSAVSDLIYGIREDGGPPNGFGISGPTTFNVADGEYHERIHLQEIYNMSEETPITFQGASGDSTKVRLYGEATNDDPYVIYFDRAEYITFRHMTIEATNQGSYSRVILMQNDASYNTLSNNILRGYNTSSTSSNDAIIYMYGTNTNYNLFENNLIEEGGYGLYMYYGYGNVVKGNTFRRHSGHFIYARYCYYPEFSDNLLIEPDNSNNYAVYFYRNYDSLKFINNIISGEFYLGLNSRYHQNSSAQDPALFANNYFNIYGSNSYYGMLIQYSHYNYVFNNSIYLKTNQSGSFAFYMYGYNTDHSYNKIKNNIFANTRGRAIYLYDPYNYPIINESDNNNYYSEENSHGQWYYNGWRYDLSDWQNQSNFDTLSISVDPRFVSPLDPHYPNIELDGKADTSVLAWVPYDIDGEIRDTVAPDIGADEFDIPLNDAGIASIDSIEDGICEGINSIYVTLINQGADTLFNSEIHWTVNGDPQTKFDYAGMLLPDSSTVVTIGEYNLSSQSEYEIKAWTTLPNGSEDFLAFNDTSYFYFNTAYTGTFTIGGEDPDFETFMDAIDAIETYGVCGEVIFNVRDGDYEESVFINEIPGTNESDMVIFQSESGDTSKVKLHSGPVGESYSVIYLNGADHIQFKNLTIAQDEEGRVIRLGNESNHVQVSGCLLVGCKTNNTGDNHAVVYSTNSIDNDLSFTNNAFLYGSYGIRLSGENTSILESGTTIENNTFTGQYYRAIYLQYQMTISVNSNVINTQTTYSSFNGIYCDYCDAVVNIKNNEIHGNIYNGIQLRNSDGKPAIAGNQVTGAINYGIELSSTHASPGSEGLIANNFVHVGGESSAYGLYLNSSGYHKVYNNSIHSSSINSSSRAFYLSGGNNVSLWNNIFANSKNGYAIYISTTSAIDSSNYNDFYSKNGCMGYWSGNRCNLEAWQTQTGMDAHSLSVDPGFLSEMDLHIVNLALNGAGDKLPEITIDIDGEDRDAVNPDIGADEIPDPPGTMDAAILSVDIIGSAPFYPTDYDIECTLSNLSKDTLNTVNIYWSVNGIDQSTYNLVGKLGTGTDSIVHLGNIAFTTGSSYQVKVWSDLPNGSADQINHNDTLEAHFYASLHGTYTIGGTSPDFSNFREASKHLMLGGLSGPVTMNIRDGVYNEQFILEYVPGSSDSTHLTLQSESEMAELVTLSFAASHPDSNYTLLLEGTNYITIRKLTIEAAGEDYGRALRFEDNDSLTITQNIFRGIEGIAGDENFDLLYSSSNDGDDKSIVMNHFEHGNYAIHLDNSGSVSGTKISGNEVNHSFGGIYLNDGYAADVSFNKINAMIYGIYLYNCDDTLKVLKNEITITGYGDAHPGPNGYDAGGIYFSSCNGSPGNYGLTANNFIYLHGDENLSGHGIYLSSSSNNYENIFHNSVNVTNTNPSSSAFYIYNTGGSVDVMNNIFANTGGGYAVYCPSTYTSYVDTSDFNNMYTTGYFIGYTNNYNIPSLKMWRFITGESSLDSNSVSVDPFFNSENDLHVNQTDLDGAGYPLALVPDDIDGTARDLANPDIGADEFELSQLDAGVVKINTIEKFRCDGEYHVFALIKNFGQTTLTSANVKWSVNGMEQSPVPWSGSLATGETSDSIQLGTYAFASDPKAYMPVHLKGWSESPNGSPDENLFNDTSRLKLNPGLYGQFIIGSSENADFNSFREAVNYLANTSGVCGPVEFLVEEGEYEEYIEIPEIGGTSSVNTITFRSLSGDNTSVELFYDGGGDWDAVVFFDGADHVIFRDMTIQQLNDWDYACLFEHGADHNRIENCVIKNMQHGYGIYSEEEDNIGEDHNVFRNNRIENGYYGIYWYGWGDNNKHETGVVVEGNEFINQWYYAIYIEYTDSSIIRNNYIINEEEGDNNYSGIYLYMYETKGYFVITGNEIIMRRGEYGIYTDYCYGLSKLPSIIANNFVSIDSDDDWYAGLYIEESANIWILNNSIRVSGAGSNSYAFYSQDGANLHILNNIFANYTNGYAYYLDWPVYAIAESDHNNFYTSQGDFLYWDDYDDINDLSLWREITGLDQNSQNVDPMFLGPEDLHTCNTDLDGAGSPIDYFTVDIDGDTRDPVTPDIGADEFSANTTVNLGSDTTLCEGHSIILDAGVSDGSYLWSTGDTTQTITVTIPDTYSVTISSVCGEGSDAIVVETETAAASAAFTYTTSFLTTVLTNASSGATDYLWRFGDGQTSTDENPVHIYISKGTYPVTLVAYHYCNSDSVTMDVTVAPVGLEEELQGGVLNIFPNPVSEKLTVELELNQPEEFFIWMYDANGRIMFNEKLDKTISYHREIDLTDYPEGMYLMQIRTDSELISRRIIKE